MEATLVGIETDSGADAALEIPALPEVQVANETCSKFGGAALICAGCPMLRFCELKTVVVDEIGVEIAPRAVVDEVDLFGSASSFGVPEVHLAPSIAVEALSDFDGSYQDDAPKSPENNPAPRPSYLERLLDDEIEVVVADSIIGKNEQQVAPVAVVEEYSGGSVAPESVALEDNAPVLPIEQNAVSGVSYQGVRLEVTPTITTQPLTGNTMYPGIETAPFRPARRSDNAAVLPIVAPAKILVRQTFAEPLPPIEPSIKPIDWVVSESLVADEVIAPSPGVLPQEESPDESIHVPFVPSEDVIEENFDVIEVLSATEVVPPVQVQIFEPEGSERVFVAGVGDEQKDAFLPQTNSNNDPTGVNFSQKTDDENLVATPGGRADEPIINSLDTVQPELRLSVDASSLGRPTTIDTVRNLAICALKWLRIDESPRQVQVC